METANYDKKIELCKKLGADRFQKFVLKIEELKYKFLNKYFPGYINWYDKLCDKKRSKELKKAKTSDERKRIIDHYRTQKLLLRKEVNTKQNRNYHVNPNKPTEILSYLNWNKEIHMNGLIKNAIAIPCLVTATVAGLWPAVIVPFLVIELGSLFVNFQCVNIQNCNIYRYKKCEEQMIKLEQRRKKRNVEQYGEVGAAITRSMEKTDDIPSLSQVIESIQTKEELEQLKKLVQKTLGANKVADQVNTAAKKSGGKK